MANYGKSGLLCPFDDAVAPDARAGSSDMEGSGEEMGVGKPGNIMENFEGAICPKSGASETGGEMKTMQFSGTPRGGGPDIELSVALNLTGSKKAGS